MSSSDQPVTDERAAEWEVTGERTVQWSYEQGLYLRAKLGKSLSEAEVRKLAELYGAAGRKAQQLEAERDRLRAALAGAAEALGPIAEYARVTDAADAANVIAGDPPNPWRDDVRVDYHNRGCPTLGDCRRAAAARRAAAEALGEKEQS